MSNSMNKVMDSLGGMDSSKITNLMKTLGHGSMPEGIKRIYRSGVNYGLSQGKKKGLFTGAGSVLVGGGLIQLAVKGIKRIKAEEKENDELLEVINDEIDRESEMN